MVEMCRADDSDFCREVVAKGLLTEEQMHRAAERYQLGKSRSGKTIFWMIDERGICQDGRIGESWVSTMLKRREPELLGSWYPEHCLFGMHLISGPPLTPPVGGGQAVAIVEQERSAVILSELYPDFLWMAVAHYAGFTIDRLKPLQGHRVCIFPNTDETMSNYVMWLELAERARSKYHLDITVSHVLEENATAQQKEQCIDLVDFLFHTD